VGYAPAWGEGAEPLALPFVTAAALALLGTRRYCPARSRVRIDFCLCFALCG
jgi:hypothetical protein